MLVHGFTPTGFFADNSNSLINISTVACAA
jgi:hypothetical protein